MSARGGIGGLGMNSGKKLFIYHEQQESALCGQHCLNNLLQGPHFTAVDLGDIASSLDEEERRLQAHEINLNRFQSNNVDDAGNFSIQVLKNALIRYNKCDLVPWHQNPKDTARPEMMEATYETNKAFVVNRSNHWFTIRKIRNNWWNLNSTSERPELISPFYLSAFLVQLRAEGYSVFLVTGKIPESGDPETSRNYLAHSATGQWYDENELLNGGPSSGGQQQQQQQKPTFAAFQGRGNRLGGDPAEPQAPVNMDEYDEELELAKAISASLEQSQAPPAGAGTVALNPKEEMRLKRLAALAAKK
jgi:ataxin-3